MPWQKQLTLLKHFLNRSGRNEVVLKRHCASQSFSSDHQNNGAQTGISLGISREMEKTPARGARDSMQLFNLSASASWSSWLGQFSLPVKEIQSRKNLRHSRQIQLVNKPYLVRRKIHTQHGTYIIRGSGKLRGTWEHQFRFLLEGSEFLESSRSFPPLRKTKTLTDRHTALDKCVAV